ncbi:MAG: LysR family transcriptional regulator [Caulobacteraceae bacterium]
MNLAKYDLNSLVALDALLEEKNVTHAGHRVGLSQSAMSGVLSRLRHMFKDELLVRVGRQMERTPLGEEIVEPLKACIRDIEKLLSSRLAFDPASEQRIFTIATSDYLSFLLLGPLIERISERAPGISLRVVQVDEVKIDQLADDLIDFVIMPSEIPSNLPSKLLFEDRWVCAVWKHNPLVQDELTVEQYVALHHLVSGQENFGIIDERLHQMGIKRRIGASVQSFLLAPFVIAGTNMVTILHRRLAERLAFSTDIRIIEPPFELPIIHESIFWNPRHSNNPPHIWMLEQIAEVTSKL